ncbi:hypothetical protein [Undibacterium sp. SXout20W]|uniref:hypothetical protein n=1 Tax=Undibacterium sp. SXout20W TaxID=3413051 RepID=UPI003BF5BB1F
MMHGEWHYRLTSLAATETYIARNSTVAKAPTDAYFKRGYWGYWGYWGVLIEIG